MKDTFKTLWEHVKFYWSVSKGGIIYALVTVSIIFLITAICGCGHNIYREIEVTGFRLAIPIGDGELGLSLGATKSVIATTRGGTSFETTSVNGGGLLSGTAGQSKISQFKTNNYQLNEGNLVAIFTSSNVPADVKLAIANAFPSNSVAPYFPGSILQTREATIHVGRAAIQSNAVESISRKSTGLDKVVETTGGIVHDAVNPLEGTIQSTENVVDKTGDIVTEVKETIAITMKDARSLVKLIGIIIAALLILFVITIILAKRKSKSATKHVKVDGSPDPEDLVPEEDHFDENMAQADKNLSDTGENLKATKSKESIGFWHHVPKIFLQIILTLAKWFRMIPPQTREKLLKAAVDYWKKKQLAKKAAKK